MDRKAWLDELFVLLAAPLAGDQKVPTDWYEAVLTFWFDELTAADWFKPGDAVDLAIHDRFLKLYANVAGMPVTAHLGSPRQALAAVIVLDQFPRNLFRGSPHAFGTDRLARRITEAAVAKGLDQGPEPQEPKQQGPNQAPNQGLTVDQRLFLYLPFEHSEDRADQERSVALISALGDATYTEYAVAHRDVIAQFGRFPHRNAALGRPSTDAEAAYLAQPGSGF